MHAELLALGPLGDALAGFLTTGILILKVVIGFSIIIFVHELGHFLAAKAMGVRVERFAIGFFYRLVGWRRGEGLTFGPRPALTPQQVREKGYGETDYCFNAFPFGGYVKMLGEGDIEVNEETGEVKTSNDPRAFPNKTVGQRMVVVSAGVIFNLLFAVVLYTLVFMTVGQRVPSPRIGSVIVGGPAARAGLLPGDRVTKIDGHEVVSLEDVVRGALLGGNQLEFEVERAGQPVRLVVNLQGTSGAEERLGISPMLDPVIMAPVPNTPLREGDRITAVDGRPLQNGQEIDRAFQASQGEPVTLTVQRKDPDATELEVTLQPSLYLVPDGDGPDRNNAHVLGLQPRRRVMSVEEKSPAERAGLKVDDVVVQWDTIPNPLYTDILNSIRSSDGKAIALKVRRGADILERTVTPRSPFRLLGGAGSPIIGVSFGWEADHPVVADVTPNSPASTLNLPRGSVLTAVAGEPVHDWFEVVRALKARAGREITVEYRTGDEKYTGRMSVPGSIVNELNLPANTAITRIADQDRVEMDGGRREALRSTAAVRALLRRHVGKTVSVEWVSDLPERRAGAGEFTVRPDNIDPWQMRILYMPPDLPMRTETAQRTAGGNPLKAIAMGGQQAYQELFKMYLIVHSMLTRKLGTENVAGPVGIVKYAYHQAEQGWGDLLAFLAFLSINLAVINFMPIPVVDGGLMMFLILEKFRGKPLSLKVQVITTLTGLAIIVISFVYVTLQDIAKLI